LIFKEFLGKINHNLIKDCFVVMRSENKFMEIIEVYLEDNETKVDELEREYVHDNNLWHREVAVWVINDNGEILIQKRSTNKRHAPNKYSICAGHIDIGEMPEDAAVRELFEETGIKIDKRELRYIDTFKNKNESNYHYKYTYFITTTKKIDEMVMQLEEVSDLKYISFDEFYKSLDENDDRFAFSNKEYVRTVLKVLKEYTLTKNK